VIETYPSLLVVCPQGPVTNPGESTREIMMRVLRCSLACLVLVILSLPAWAGDKEKDQDTFKNGARVLQEMLNSDAVPATLLAKADCVIVLPSVKKFGSGVGGSGGRAFPSSSTVPYAWEIP